MLMMNSQKDATHKHMDAMYKINCTWHEDALVMFCFMLSLFAMVLASSPEMTFHPDKTVLPRRDRVRTVSVVFFTDYRRGAGRRGTGCDQCRMRLRASSDRNWQ